jgi:hypothetical protein
MVGHGAHLALGLAGGDNHVVRDVGFSGEVDDDKILGLVILE